MMLKLIEGR